MKNLLYKNEKYYLCDGKDTKDGKTCIVYKYTVTKTSMPHNNFKNKLVIYARSTCPYCIDFLLFLKKTNKKTYYYDNLIYIEVDSESSNDLFSKSNLLKNLKTDIGSHSTFPIVFYKGKFIGGSDESKTYFKKL